MRFLLLPMLLSLTACATQGTPSGRLTSYEGLKPRDGAVRTAVSDRKDEDALAKVKQVILVPTQFADAPDTAWLTPAERTLLLREIDAQICFEVSERYAIATDLAAAEAQVRTIVTRVAPTGRVGSAASAAASFFIPGPIGLRSPAGLGGLGAEAEMLAGDGRQLAALIWNRTATPVGTDDPSLNRLGDALQLAEPFADAVGAVLSPTGVKSRGVDKPDPCAQYGSRLRVEGFATKFATGLYVPQMSGAKAAEAPEAPAN